jgi:hypothetical protein
MLFLPACLAVYSSIKLNQMLMFISFIWSVPMSMFMLATPGIFALYGMTSLLYFISFLLIRYKK